MHTITMLNEVTSTGPGGEVGLNKPGDATFHGAVAGSGAVTAEIDIEGSNDEGDTWVKIATISLDGTDSDVAGFAESPLAWDKVRANVTSITGTSAKASVIMALGLSA